MQVVRELKQAVVRSIAPVSLAAWCWLVGARGGRRGGSRGPEMAYEGENYAPYGGPVGSAKELCLRSLKRTHTMYLSNYGQRPDFEEPCAAPPPFPPECLGQEGPISHGRWCFAG